MIERKAEQMLEMTDTLVEPLFVNSPAIGRMASTFIAVKKREFIPKLQAYCDLLVETSCMDPDISLDAAITNAEDTLNQFISEFVSQKLDLPLGVVSISLQTLFGDKVVKL